MTPIAELLEPVRNRWFTGKMLDAFHMELETDYGDRKRWLLNRLVLGSGVAQGLDVLPGPDPMSVIVTPGMAIDWKGREIIVPTGEPPSVWKVPEVVVAEAKKHQHHADGKGEKPPSGRVHVRVALCYLDGQDVSAPTDPGTGCGCDPGSGTIREGYEVCFDPHPAPPVQCRSRVPNLFDDADHVHAVLARWVTRHLPHEHKSPCITLANLLIDAGSPGARCEPEHIDITVRPIVYSNDLLYEMILGLFRSPDGPTDPK